MKIRTRAEEKRMMGRFFITALILISAYALITFTRTNELHMGGYICYGADGKFVGSYPLGNPKPASLAGLCIIGY